MDHPFGELLNTYLRRKYGLSRAKLAAGINQPASLITLMGRGQRLTGAQARERVIAIIEWFYRQRVLQTIEEANGLLAAAGLAGLNMAVPDERALCQRLAQASARPPSSTGPLAPASPASHTRTNLPAHLPAMIGRERELKRLIDLLEDAYLISLIGAGGAGKTLLSLQLATCVLTRFSGGVFFISLAPLHESELIAPAILQVLGITETGRQPAGDMLRAYLQDKQMLLILDNIEHLPAAAPLIVSILNAAPQLKLVITSRVALQISEVREHVFEVRPLAVPQFEAPAPVDAILQSAAVQLFLHYARQANPEFKLTEHDSRAIAEICQRVGGLPLAIELAAARATLFSPQEMIIWMQREGLLGLLKRSVQRVQRPFDRHQAMSDTIAWSYRLLDSAAQALFARLAVFRGGWTLEAAQAICAVPDDHGTEALDILDKLSLLFDSHLIYRQSQADGPSRFAMLEPIREYAQEQLLARGEDAAIRRAHAAFYQELAEQGKPALHGPEQKQWLTRLEQEHANFRATLEWAAGSEASGRQIGMAVAIALSTFWYLRGYLSEGRLWLERFLEQRNALPALLQAQSAGAAGMLVAAQGDFALARSYQQESLHVYRELLYPAGIADALHHLGSVLLNMGEYSEASHMFEEGLIIQQQAQNRHGQATALYDLARARAHQTGYREALALFEESLHIYQDLADTRGIATVLCELGWQARGRSDYETARTLLQESLAMFTELGDRHNIAFTVYGLGQVMLDHADLDAARGYFAQYLAMSQEVGDKSGTGVGRIYLGLIAILHGDQNAALTQLQQALVIFRELGDHPNTALTMMFLALAVYHQGNYAEALAYIKESLAIRRQQRDYWQIAMLLEGLGVLLATQGEPQQGLRFLGMAETVRETIGVPRIPIWESHLNVMLAPVYTRLSMAEVAAAKAEGRTIPPEEAVARALAIAAEA